MYLHHSLRCLFWLILSSLLIHHTKSTDNPPPPSSATDQTLSSTLLNNVESLLLHLIKDDNNLIDALTQIPSLLPRALMDTSCRRKGRIVLNNGFTATTTTNPINSSDTLVQEELADGGEDDDLINQLNCLSLEFNDLFSGVLKQLKTGVLDRFVQRQGNDDDYEDVNAPTSFGQRIVTKTVTKLINKLVGNRKHNQPKISKGMWKKLKGIRKTKRGRFGKWGRKRREVAIPWDSVGK